MPSGKGRCNSEGCGIKGQNEHPGRIEARVRFYQVVRQSSKGLQGSLSAPSVEYEYSLLSHKTAANLLRSGEMNILGFVELGLRGVLSVHK
eukprot:6781646-Pyramimonas_sp.AAC.1